MSLLSLGQKVFDNARQLFDGLQKPVDGQQPQPSVLQRFGIFGFNGNKSEVTGANQSLHNVSRIVAANVGNPTVANVGSAQPITEVREGATKDGGYISAVSVYDLGQGQWSNKVDPKAVSLIAYARGVMQAGVTSDPELAKQIAERQANGIVLHFPSGKSREVTSKDFGDRDFIKTYTDPQGRFVMLLSKDDLARARALAKELGGEASGLQSQAGAGAAVLGLSLAMPLPKQFDWSKVNVRAAATAAGAVGAELAPLAPIAIGLAGQGALVRQRLEIERGKWEATQKGQVLPPPTIIQNTQRKPETTTAERPKTTVTDLPNAPTDLAPTEKAKPQAKPQTKAQPQTTEQPTTQQPTQPNAPQVKPPRLNPDDILKATTAATATATLGTAAKNTVDAISSSSQVISIEKVKYGSTELSQAAIQHRKDNGIKTLVNIANFKYLDNDGNIKIKTLASENGVHSELMLDRWLESEGIPRENVKEVYTEREPCRPPIFSNCDKLLGTKYPDAKVSYSFEYGTTLESRQRGNAELKEALKEVFKK